MRKANIYKLTKFMLEALRELKILKINIIFVLYIPNCKTL